MGGVPQPVARVLLVAQAFWPGSFLNWHRCRRASVTPAASNRSAA